LIGGGARETFWVSSIYHGVHEILGDFASHLAGPDADILSLPGGPFNDSFVLLLQPSVGGKAEHIVDPVRLAPGHQGFAGEAGSARRTIFTRGERARMWPTMRSVSSTAPALASMLECLSLATIRCRPQNT